MIFLDTIKIKSRAKINLTLDVISKRPDGYHNLEMIMQTLELGDDILIKKSGGGVTVKTDAAGIPSDGRNTAYKAASLFIKEYGIGCGVEINITQRVPAEAGLAGGSGDAAAVLKGMDALFATGITEKELLRMGAEIGSDVPFCIMEGTALAKGRGEILERLAPCPKFYVVLAKPDEGVSTADIFGSLDADSISWRPDSRKVIKAINEGDKNGVLNNLGNVLEEVTAKRLPVINDVKAFLNLHGAGGALMSGSGSTVFALFNTEADARAAAEAAKKEFMFKDVLVTETFNP